MKNFLIILFCILQGCSSSAQNDTLCEKYNTKSAEFVYEFQMYGDTFKLDSALYYIELAIPICSFEYRPNLVGRKLGILSLKHDYNAGIEYIPTINDSLLPYYPYYKTVLLKRFHAMKSLYEGDTIQRNQYVHSIIEDIQLFITDNQTMIDSLCKSEDLQTILKNSLFLAPMQYYYYKSIVEDSTIFAKELDLLNQKGYNSDYVETIKTICAEDFLTFQLW